MATIPVGVPGPSSDLLPALAYFSLCSRGLQLPCPFCLDLVICLVSSWSVNVLASLI